MNLVAPNIQFWLLLGFVFLIVILIVFVRLLSGVERKPLFQYRRKEYLMSATERECYDALTLALGSEYYIFPQVHLDCLLQPQAYGRNKIYAFRHINQKSVDFVVCDKKFRILLAIELDDKTHERSDRIERDGIVEALFKDAGVRLVRIKSQRPFDAQELGATVRSAISPESTAV